MRSIPVRGEARSRDRPRALPPPSPPVRGLHDPRSSAGYDAEALPRKPGRGPPRELVPGMRRGDPRRAEDRDRGPGDARDQLEPRPQLPLDETQGPTEVRLPPEPTGTAE